ncbi:ATP-binding protein [Sphingosinicella sp. LHD-64]|uniref:sensor histidine kinase n=1 Tax=Sphingosinicella sp. LHD-64 TaxID=3072139 RepID=UPI00280F527D|nr:ATP-binding protein [Sphingosinicella sp. LHD-64]MDQ8754789.1 ATP-binding protein [Sphingosinicella sp. LHD-64]
MSPAESRPRWRRRLSVALKRSSFVPLIEIAAVIALITTVVISYVTLERQGDAGALLTPPMVAVLLVANLVPAMALMVLVARRLAKRRAALIGLGMKSRLPVRLVAIFSGIAAVPTLLVVIFASLLFQYGVEFWFSDRARGMLENAASLAQENYNREVERVGLEAVAMSGDLAGYLQQVPIDSTTFAGLFGRQVFERNLSEAIIFRVARDNGIQSLALVDPYDRSLESVITPQMIASVRPEQPNIIVSNDRFAAIAALPYGENTYIYTARVFEPELASQLRRGAAVLEDYRTLVNRSRNLQLRFNIALFALSLLIVGLAIWIALTLADRLVRPVNQLVGAARRVTAGDLSARVPQSETRDEVATLGNAFNRMTSRLEEQTGALVSANAQLDSRRAFTEAVLSGVTAGVISVDENHVVRLINSSAESLLNTGGKSPVGLKLAGLAPELDQQLAAEEREEIVQVASGGEPRTLALKTVKVEGGYVLTFDDITEQLLDQRRAAWSDVARRIAHEIKNPLTPIQLAAERLQRRYSGEVVSDPATFERLTGTIVRQVGDLRRMVDEFSSFARMPKPIFREEPIVDIARQALFLHEVAHPDIRFALEAPDPSPILVCDRRLLGQALTNVVKNGVEAIQQRREELGREGGDDRIAIAVRVEGSRLTIEVTDTGVGLPADRRRLTEPYMTTRAKGTGLGLAIVKKIVEEHFGQIEFDDARGGGSLVRFQFDVETLGRLIAPVSKYSEDSVASG